MNRISSVSGLEDVYCRWQGRRVKLGDRASLLGLVKTTAGPCREPAPDTGPSFTILARKRPLRHLACCQRGKRRKTTLGWVNMYSCFSARGGTSQVSTVGLCVCLWKSRHDSLCLGNEADQMSRWPCMSSVVSSGLREKQALHIFLHRPGEWVPEGHMPGEGNSWWSSG